MLLSVLNDTNLYLEVLFFSHILNEQKMQHNIQEINPEIYEYMELIIRHVETFSQIKWEIENTNKNDPFVLVYYKYR